MTKFWNWLRAGVVASVALVAIGVWYSVADYTATQGSGTTYGSKDLAGVKYPSMTLCDQTTGGQCAGVTAAGNLNVSATAVQSGTWTVQPGNTANTTAWLFNLVQGGNTATVTAGGLQNVSATAADGAIVTLGNTTDAASTAGGTGSASAKLRLMTTQLDNINTNIQQPIPQGTNHIGFVTIKPLSPTSGVTVSSTSAFSQTAMGAQGGSNRFFMTDFSCSNSGSSTTVAHFLNAGNNIPIWTTIIPSGGGSNKTFTSPISTSANTALIISTLTASTTVYCNVSGFPGT